MANSSDSISCSVIFHNYYGGHEDWVRFFCDRISIPFNLFYNIVEDSFYNPEDKQDLANRLKNAASGTSLRKIILRRSSNKGKDIGGKLVLLDACLREGINDQYQIFLHDKKSPHKIQGQEWREKLFRIIEPSFIEKALAFFSEHPDTGIISTSESIMDEYDHTTRAFISKNRMQLEKLRAEFDIDNKDYRYVAGTMFWARSVPFLGFFRKYPPLEARKTLEMGNIMDENGGSVTHAWERMLSWLTFNQGYTIKGL